MRLVLLQITMRTSYVSAKTLELTIPPMLLDRANRVIE
jgi:hypothetical protein